jgi:hypothetical protein
MTSSETQIQKPGREVPLPHPLAEEIERALEMMRRVRIAQVAQGKAAVVETPGNKYELPEPLVYPVSSSSHRE